MSSHGERPRSVGPARAAAILYGDWGTSKAYVLGIAFAIAGYSSFPILIAMAALTALVGLNYYWVCSQYPDGGGVYSAVRERSPLIAVIGALLLIADYLVTASLSVLEGFNYLAHLCEMQFGIHLPRPDLMAIGMILALGILNWWGPKHSGSFAIFLAIPASIAAASIALLALPHLGEAHFQASSGGFMPNWMLFASIVLALSGVEAVSNMTGIMVPDPKPDARGHVSVRRTSAWTIGLVAFEVVTLTVLLAWAMHAVPGLDREKTDAMLGQMAGHFGSAAFGAAAGTIYASVVGVVMALLLFSAGNTAIIGMISVYYMMSKDRELPSAFGRLNGHGVPKLPLLLASVLPSVLLIIYPNVTHLAALYAIGVVGAITINLGACSTNRHLPLGSWVRFAMGATAFIMMLIWITIAVEKHSALIFAISILAFGLFSRAFVQERRDFREEKEIQGLLYDADEAPDTGQQRVLVCLRGVTNTLQFAAEEAQIRNARLGVLYIRQEKVLVALRPDLKSDPEALKILQAARAADENLPIDFIYRVSDDVAGAIIQATRDYKADYLILGASAEGAIATLLRGSLVTGVAEQLPRRTKLLIYSWKPQSSMRRRGNMDLLEEADSTGNA